MIAHWTYIFRGAFTPTECSELIGFSNGIPEQVGSIGHGGTSIVDPNMRRSEVKWFSKRDARLQSLFFKLQTLCDEANLKSFNFDLSGFLDVQFTKYTAPGGHYDWHEDNNWVDGKPSTRKLSMVLQLTNPAEYEGGQLELQGGMGLQTLQQGDVLFFPSFLKHRVTPMTAGVRHSLVTWFMGPQWR